MKGSVSKNLLSIAVLAAVSLSLSACRFGNREEEGKGPEQPAQPSNPDNVTGFYKTEPRALKFCMGMSGSGATCLDSNSTHIPPFIGRAMVNPVALVAIDFKAGDFALYDYDYPNQRQIPFIPVLVDKAEKKLIYLGETPFVLVWPDSLTCARKISLYELGYYNSDARGSTVNGKPIWGSLELFVRVIEQYDQCSSALSEMEACYANVTNCGGATNAENDERLALVQELFGPYIESGAMDAADISEVESASYEVTYE